MDTQKIYYLLNAYHLITWAKVMEKWGFVISKLWLSPIIQKVFKAMNKKKIHEDKKKVDNFIIPAFLILQYLDRIISLFH